MKVSRRWLEAFLRRELDPRELVEKLAMAGAPADAVMAQDGGLGDLVVALVEEVRPHPNADRLRVCTVNDGTPERRTVVCGAPNVTAGGKYPFAPIGASLPGGLVIEKRKIRGETSEGMLCSARELGLGTDHEGILALDTAAGPGTRFLAVLGTDDHQLELDISPVRPDLLGHKGIARELAAAYRTAFRLPDIPGAGEVLPSVRPSASPSVTTGAVTIEIQPSACARFTGAVIRGVKVAASPEWLKRRLEAVGQRSVNNVVDVTNYIMLELGQPMHAYDLGKLRGNRVIARRARAGETLVTLDGVERKLAPEMSVIADAEGVVGVAGVMGGSGSEVSEATTDLFLECAWFDPKETRATRRRLSLLTEASQRFERGTDLWGVPEALRRGLMVLQAVAGGTVEGDPADCWPAPANPQRIFLRTGRVAQVLGVELSRETLEQCLVAIGAAVVNKPDEQRIAVEVPGWRPDLREEIDLVEEVARVYGYGAFPDELRPFRAGNQVDAPMTLKLDALRRHLAAEGLYEAILIPLGPRDAADAVPVLNPLSSEHGYLRTALRSGLLRQVEANWASQTRDVRLFELGTVFSPGKNGGLPEEATHAAAVLTGARAPQHWTDGGHPDDCDLWDIRGLFERALSLANPSAVVQVEGTGWIARRPDGAVVGWAGPLAADAPPWAAPLFGMEVTVDSAPGAVSRYQPLPVTPAAIRDLALIVPAGVTAEAVTGSVRSVAGSLLESIRPIDEYRGKGLPAGARSLALRLVFRSRDRTLRDGDVDLMIQRILAQLGSLDVVIRAS